MDCPPPDEHCVEERAPPPPGYRYRSDWQVHPLWAAPPAALTLAFGSTVVLAAGHRTPNSAPVPPEVVTGVALGSIGLAAPLCGTASYAGNRQLRREGASTPWIAGGVGTLLLVAGDALLISHVFEPDSVPGAAWVLPAAAGGFALFVQGESHRAARSKLRRH